jgi:hypothetical protein
MAPNLEQSFRSQSSERGVVLSRPWLDGMGHSWTMRASFIPEGEGCDE